MRIVDDSGVDLAPGQVGEVLVRGLTCMKEYWNNPQATAETMKNGWMHSGDMSRVDKEGFVYLVDRKKDVIISGAENVYPAEVEKVLAAHPQIIEVAVIGQRDQRWGESPVAVVRITPGVSLSAGEVVSFCRGKLGGYKIPKRVIFMDQPLPRTPLGKVAKRVLREQLTL